MSEDNTESETVAIHTSIRTVFGRWRQAVAVLAVFLAVVSHLSAGQVTIAWDEPDSNTDGSELTDLAGYIIDYGDSSGNYSSSLDVGPSAQATIGSLSDGGTYYFSVKAYNAAGEQSDGSEELVAVINRRPIAVDDLLQITSGATATVDVLENDSDPDSDPLQVQSVSAPANGVLVVNADQTLDYSSDAGFVGSDSFTYTIADGRGGTASAIVTVEVQAGVPPAGPESIELEAENARVTSPMTVISDADASGGAYISSTSYNDGMLEVTFDAAGGDYIVWALSASGSPNPSAHNSFYVSIDGGTEDIWDLSYDEVTPVTDMQWDHLSTRSGGSYNNNLADPRIFTLAAGSHSLLLRGRETDTRLDKIVITSDMSYVPGAAPAVPPEISLQPADLTVLHGTPAVFSVSVQSQGTPVYQWYRDGATVAGATDLSYLIEAVHFAADDGAAFYAVVSDEFGAATSRVAVLTVTAMNNNPSALNDTAQAEAGSSVTINAAQNDYDVDGDLIAVVSVTSPSHGTAVLREDEMILYTPDSMYIGSDAFSYSIVDTRGGGDSGVITVTVADTKAPTVVITSPTEDDVFVTTNEHIDIEGTATDLVGVTGVRYSNSRSASGDVYGAEFWSAYGIPLYSGENIITVTAFDDAGHAASDVLSVMYESAYPKLDEAVLRAGMAVQNIQIPDNVKAGERVTAQWQVLSYVPLRSALSVALPEGASPATMTVNAVRTGSIDGRWHVGDRRSKLYSFECTWIVPSTPGACRLRFVCAEQDGFAYINANIPSGVDSRPYGTDGKEILRDIVATGAEQEIVSEPFAMGADIFDTLSNAVLRAGGTIERIDVTDNVAPNSTVLMQWDVLTYVPIRSRVMITLPSGDTVMAEAKLVSLKNGRWMLSTYQSKVYTFEYSWDVPAESGECRIRFLNAQMDAYAWMNGNIPGGVDSRPYRTDGKEIERTIADSLVEQE